MYFKHIKQNHNQLSGAAVFFHLLTNFNPDKQFVLTIVSNVLKSNTIA